MILSRQVLPEYIRCGSLENKRVSIDLKDSLLRLVRLCVGDKFRMKAFQRVAYTANQGVDEAPQWKAPRLPMLKLDCSG